MNCHSVDNIWDYYWDKRLLPAFEAKIKAHIDACPRCLNQAKAQFAFQSLMKGERTDPARFKLPEPIKLQEEPFSIGEWLGDSAHDYAPAYVLTLVYLALTPVLKSLSFRFY